MSDKIDWIIYLIANGTCPECGNNTAFLPYICNAYTDGMWRYHHMEFQLVLNLPPQEIGYILNSLRQQVQAGKVFHAGDFVPDIYKDCSLRLDEYEIEGKKVLRVIIPDEHQRFPEDKNCSSIFMLQRLKTEMLYLEGGVTS